MPTTCWGVQRHQRALPASAPRSVQVWGALVSAHETWEKPEPKGGIGVCCFSGACRKPVIDPAQVMFAVPLLPWLGVVFKPADSSTTGTVWCHRTLGLWHSLLQTAGRDLWRLMPQLKWRWLLQWRLKLLLKEGNKMTLDRFYLKGFTPALNFRETGDCLQLMWVQVCSLGDLAAPWQQTCLQQVLQHEWAHLLWL